MNEIEVCFSVDMVASLSGKRGWTHTVTWARGVGWDGCEGKEHARGSWRKIKSNQTKKKR